MERCGKSRVEGERVERLLERLPAVLFASVPGERDGVGCFRGRYACITGVSWLLILGHSALYVLVKRGLTQKARVVYLNRTLIE